MTISGIDISKVSTMAQEVNFILESQKTNQTNSIQIPEATEQSFGGMTGKESVFDIVANAAAKNKSAGNPTGLGGVIDILG